MYISVMSDPHGLCVYTVSVSMLILNASRPFPHVWMWPDPSITSETWGTLGPGMSLLDAASPSWTDAVPL